MRVCFQRGFASLFIYISFLQYFRVIQRPLPFLEEGGRRLERLAYTRRVATDEFSHVHIEDLIWEFRSTVVGEQSVLCALSPIGRRFFWDYASIWWGSVGVGNVEQGAREDHTAGVSLRRTLRSSR